MSFFQPMFRFFGSLRSGVASRVIFYYPGEEPTYLEDAYVILHKNGIVEVFHRNEQVTTHVQNVEILWKQRRGTGAVNAARGLTLVKSDAQPQG